MSSHVSEIVRGILATVRRFPGGVLSCLFVTALTIVVIELGGDFAIIFGEVSDDGEKIWMLNRLIATALFAYPLLISAALLSEYHHRKLPDKIILQLTAIAAAVVFFLGVPALDSSFYRGDWIRMLILFGFALSTVFFVPFISRFNNSAALWKFSLVFLKRLILAIIYTGIFYAGLVIILLTLQYLFGLRIPGELYADFWVFMAGIVAQLYFLAGLPREDELSSHALDFPQILRTGIKWVLIPLMTLYALVLTAYGLFALTGNWPKGGVAGLIIFFALVGFFIVFISYPLSTTLFARIFPLLLLPLTVLLFVAVILRISQYGVTESRYLGIGLGMWILALALYFIVSRKKSIAIIPVSLAVLLLLSGAGPGSALAISRWSQNLRLERLLGESGLLSADGKLQPKPRDATIKQAGEINDLLYYMQRQFGFEHLEKRFTPDTRLLVDTVPHDRYRQAELIIQFLGLSEYRGGRHFSLQYYPKYPEILHIGGYDYALLSRGYSLFLGDGFIEKPVIQFSVEGRDFSIEFQNTGHRILIREKNRVILDQSVEPIMQNLISQHPEAFGRYSTPLGEPPSFTLESDAISMEIILHFLAGNISSEGKIEEELQFKGHLLFRLK